MSIRSSSLVSPGCMSLVRWPRFQKALFLGCTCPTLSYQYLWHNSFGLSERADVWLCKSLCELPQSNKTSPSSLQCENLHSHSSFGKSMTTAGGQVHDTSCRLAVHRKWSVPTFQLHGRPAQGRKSSRQYCRYRAHFVRYYSQTLRHGLLIATLHTWVGLCLQ